jgi:aconitase B
MIVRALNSLLLIKLIARETQVIRSATGHSFDEFKLHTDKIYKNGERYTILLGVVWEVYASVDLREEPTDVFNSLFDFCINQTMLKMKPQELKLYSFNWQQNWRYERAK